MRLRHLVVAALTTVLATPTALLTTSAPADAATATQIVGGTDGKPWIYPASSPRQPGAVVYGDTIELSIEVEANGSQVYDGTLTVQRQLPGHGWKTIKTSDSAYLYDSTKAVGNANYRVLYSGTADYAPSQAGVTGKVQRKLTLRNVGDRRVVLDGKVSPRYHGKVTVFKKAGKQWRKYKTVRTNRKSHFRTPLPAPRKGKYFWKVEIPKSRAFVKSQSGTFYTYSV